ncbi:MAG: ABC transporter permease [Bifidobacteriaceae bacterium]|jgi:ABC-type dipeptide/oligopeptide/nickel transport system permease subunit|nr:ABC transporter permease [Bifidobacteriaceae bacterium]
MTLPPEIGAEVALDAAATGEAGIAQLNSWQHMWRRLRADRAAMAAIVFIVLVGLLALLAPVIAHLAGHGFSQQFRDTGMTPDGLPVGPDSTFWMGTDQLGRDVFVRLAYGAQVSLLVGVVASLIAAIIGVTVGVVAGYFGGWADAVLSRVTDFVMSIPFLLCALALVSVFGASVGLCLFVVVFFSWAVTGRVIRAQVRALKEREFVEASRSLGASTFSIVFKDILPNLAEPIIVYTTQMIPSAIVFEATLSFLGMGIVPPQPSWGGMLSDAATNSTYMIAPWMVFAPGSMLLLTTLAFNILGDGLRDALDPKASRRLFGRKRRRAGRGGQTASAAARKARSAGAGRPAETGRPVGAGGGAGD